MNRSLKSPAMSFGMRSRMTAMAVIVLAVAAAAILTVIAFLSARPASADTFDDCPQGGIPSGTKVDNQVGALSSASGGTVTYTFDSWVNLNSSGGSPGLQEYCVYTSTLPD